MSGSEPGYEDIRRSRDFNCRPMLVVLQEAPECPVAPKLLAAILRLTALRVPLAPILKGCDELAMGAAMNLFDRTKRFALSTVQPYRVLGRGIIAFNVLLAFIFFALAAFRLWLDHPQCNEQLVQIGSKHVLIVQASCLSEHWLSSFGKSIVDNLAAGLVVAMVSSLLLWLISPKAHFEEDIAALQPWNIHELLHAPLADTKNYWFRGRSGRFIRTAVMPALDAAGRRESVTRTLHMILPNPADTSMLADYAHYRASLQGAKGQWDASRIQNEILATIISAAKRANTNHFFEVEIYLKSDFALFRLDMSDDRLVLTREDPKWPGIVCSSRSKFYASYHEEFRNEANRAVSIDLSLATVPTSLQSSDVDGILAALSLSITLTDEDRTAIVQGVEKPESPYG
ncbi:hypothetical protein [Novosphingobium profundi]|uniref:hypothetical protein n=1 Tax=Novosphingobium profundi TaxID=1774954 RepID=UPI001CFDCC47|nr:hypothetical protein [Novosphingobium profundi]